MKHLDRGLTVFVACIAWVALAQVAVTFAVGWGCFGVTVTGSVVGFVVMALSAALLSAATGLLVAALGGNEGRARSVAAGAPAIRHNKNLSHRRSRLKL